MNGVAAKRTKKDKRPSSTQLDNQAAKSNDDAEEVFDLDWSMDYTGDRKAQPSDQTDSIKDSDSKQDTKKSNDISKVSSFRLIEGTIYITYHTVFRQFSCYYFHHICAIDDAYGDKVLADMSKLFSEQNKLKRSVEINESTTHQGANGSTEEDKVPQSAKKAKRSTKRS